MTTEILGAATLYGGVVLHAERQHVPLIDMPALSGLQSRAGHHIPSRSNGTWFEINSVPATEIYLPQRYKHLTLSTTNESTRIPLFTGLEELDSLYVGERQSYKLNKLLETIDDPFAAVVNIASAVSEGSPVSGSFYLFSNTTPLHMALVFDAEENSVQLVWSTLDFKLDMQARNLFRYVFFPLPTIVNRAVFAHTQNLCAKWWKLTKNFGSNKHGLLRAANALELILYK